MYEILPTGCITDKNMRYMMKRVWIPANSMIQGQITGASVILTADAAGLVGTIVPLPTGLSALKYTATTENTDLLWRIPYDFDNRHPLRLRVLWTSDKASANCTMTYKFLYNAVLPATAPVVGATALTSPMVLSTKASATADIPQWTNYGVIAPLATGALAYQTFDDRTEFLALRGSVSAVTVLTLASDFIYLYGWELAYTPKIMFGDGSNREGVWPEANLSQMAADPVVQQQ